MTNLRNFLTELGFENVRSLLQSGNLVFGSRSRFGAELERYLEMEASKRLALEVDFHVRTAEEWKSMVRQNPFRKEAERDPGHLIVLFLKNAPAAKDVALAQRTGSKDAYLMCLDGLVTMKRGEVAKGKALIKQSLEIDPYQNHTFAAQARKVVQG